MNTMARDSWRGWRLSLDFRRAVRMLATYPLLTIVAGARMAFGIAAGMGGFEIRRQSLDPILMLEDGRSILGLPNWDVQHDRPALSGEAGLRAWLEQGQSVERLGDVACWSESSPQWQYGAPRRCKMTTSEFQIAEFNQFVAQPLITPLAMMVGGNSTTSTSKMALAEGNQAIETLLIDRTIQRSARTFAFGAPDAASG